MRFRTFLGLSTVVFALAACGGGGGCSGVNCGGGGGSGPYTLPKASPNVLSAFTLDSAPQGLQASVDGTVVGNTPQTSSPAYSNTPHTFSIKPSGAAAAYTVNLAQTANGSHTIFYNAAIDTAGKITSVSSTTFSQVRQALAPVGGPRRMGTGIAGRPLYSDRRLTVTYDLSRMGNARTFTDIESAHGANSAVTLAQSSTSVTRVVTLAAGTTLDAARSALAGEAGVSSVDLVRLRYPLASPKGPQYPNDTYYAHGDQWYLNTVDAPDAWGYGLGHGRAIAIVDTGYDPAQTEVAPMVSYAEKVVGGTASTGKGVATDTDGHGTYVSGIASAVTNNGAGFAGIGWGASLLEFKVYPDELNPVADAADESYAIREAVGHGAAVIVLALGGPSSAGPDPNERDAVAYAISKGVVVVAGSGDEGASTVDYPAALPGVIAVGASAIDDSAAPGSPSGPEYVPTYSNYGPGLALVAPGGDPTSGTDTDLIHWIRNSYTTVPLSGNASCGSVAPSDCALLASGTSPASALVGGAAAVMLENGAKPSQVATILQTTADNIGDAHQGAGRMNFFRAMASVTGDKSPNPTPPLPSNIQFVAFAYANAGGTKPTILDVTYPAGVPVASDGTFRIADIPAAADGTYKIAVWADLNGDGIVDAGDYFGVSSTTNKCASNGACSGANNITAKLVATGFTLP